MGEQLLIATSIGWLVAQVGSTAISIIGANIFDTVTTLKDRNTWSASGERIGSGPLISVIIYTNHQSQNISQCINSVIKNSYLNYEILLVDNHSGHGSHQICKDFKSAHPKLRLRIYTRRKQSTRQQTLLAAHKKLNGQYAVVLNADSYLGSNALEAIIQRFESTSSPRVLASHRQVDLAPNMLALFQKFYSLRSFHANKASSLVGLTSAISPDGLAFKTSHYREIIIENKKPLKAHYFPKFIVYVQPTASFYRFIRSELINLSRQNKVNYWRVSTTYLTKLIQPVALTYILMLAVNRITVSLLLISLLAFSIQLVFAIWSEKQAFLYKMILIGLIPAMYSLFYAYSFIDALIRLRIVFSLLGHRIHQIRQRFMNGVHNQTLGTPNSN